MQWILVPLQYLYLVKRAEWALAAAAGTPSGPDHNKAIHKAVDAIYKTEIMQRRFPDVTLWIDLRRNTEALRAQIEA